MKCLFCCGDGRFDDIVCPVCDGTGEDKRKTYELLIEDVECPTCEASIRTDHFRIEDDGQVVYICPACGHPFKREETV